MSDVTADLEIVVTRDRVNDLPLPPPLAPPPPPRKVPRFAPPRGDGAAWVEPEPSPAAPPEELLELGIAVPDSRRPRLGATVNGARFDHLIIDGTVVNNGYYTADSFRLTVAMEEGDGFSPAFWDGEDRLEIEVLAGFGTSVPPNKSLVLGRVDDVEMDLSERLIFLSGRDFTADLIETKTTEKWPNKTASEIAVEIAGRHGLTPVVTPTTVQTGKYYQHEHARLSDDTTEWNLLCYLAEQEGMDVYVSGRELHFEPPGSAAGRWTVTYTPPEPGRPPQAAVQRLQLRESKSLSREISVKVLSWNSKKKKPIEVNRSTNLSKRKGVGGRRTPYVFRLPGLTEEQAIREAERRLADITKHLRVVQVHLPGHPDVTPRSRLALKGTGTSFDQEYRIDEVTRRMTQEGGFEMDITAKNMDPESSASIQ